MLAKADATPAFTAIAAQGHADAVAAEATARVLSAEVPRLHETGGAPATSAHPLAPLGNAFAALGAAPLAAAHGNAPPSATVAAPFGTPAFAPALAASVTLLARDGVQEARLQLHPAELGPIAVQIAIDGTQARVDFTAEVAATRQAIEAGLPELASALREAGLTLAGGGVFQQPREHAHGGANGQGSPDASRGGAVDAGDDLASAHTAHRRLVSAGGVDEYA
jgi:flagellar hook-length control protein FliK